MILARPQTTDDRCNRVDWVSIVCPIHTRQETQHVAVYGIFYFVRVDLRAHLPRTCTEAAPTHPVLLRREFYAVFGIFFKGNSRI